MDMRIRTTCRHRFPTCCGIAAFFSIIVALAAFSIELRGAERRPMRRTLDSSGFHTTHGERFWSRPLHGPNRRSFVPTGELPHAAFLWFDPQGEAYVRCAHFLPGVVSPRGAKWLYEAEDVTATYDPGMMRFTVRDPAWDGELRLELVPLAPGDGYAVRVTAAQPVEFLFAFGGFLCMPDKDDYQGNTELPKGIAAELCRDADYSSIGEDITVATLRNIIGIQGKPLAKNLPVALLADRRMHKSFHEIRAQMPLAELLQQPPGAAPIQVQSVSLAKGESLNLVAVVPERDKLEAEVAALQGKAAATFDCCKKRVEEISHRVWLETPDTLLDLGARSLCVSMDALWYPPVFLHGPIRWGWPGLAGWRMAYGADVCGNHDRTASHCKYYGDHRGTGGLDRKPHLDPASPMTRQASDSVLFSQGSVVNWGIYNMTEMWLSFIAHHYAWTGDADYLRSMWPAIRDAVAFQKRVFVRGDSLYENYANTYISDAHWHNGGQCAQASAYTYRGNLLAAEAARLVGESPEPYLAEAAQIRDGMNRVLWIKEKGVYAEWKDTLGEKLVHPEPELGSIYLPIDCGVADPFQAYQMLRFTEWGLPNHVFEERGPQPFDNLCRRDATYEFPQPMQAREVKSSNWRPIILTVHECSPGEQMDTARAYYKLGLNDRAFPLVKSVLRCMVNLTAVGGLVIRDRNTEEEFSRAWSNGDVDHCDTLGPSLQCIAEGVFGIHPHMADRLVEIQPGFPSGWDHARIELRDIAYSFRREGNTDTFSVTTSKPTAKRLRLVMRGDGALVKVDGQTMAEPKIVPSVCHPFLEVESPEGKSAEFSIEYGDAPLPSLEYARTAARGRAFEVGCRNGRIVEIRDPQEMFTNVQITDGRFSATAGGCLGHHTAFLRVKGRAVDFWLPVDVEVRPPLEVVDVKLSDDAQAVGFAVRNHGGQEEDVQAVVDCAGTSLPVAAKIVPHGTSSPFSLPLRDARLVPGQNPLRLSIAGRVAFATHLECWNLLQRAAERKKIFRFEPIDISPHFNDDLALVHTHEYRSPRSPYCSLQIAGDIYREWCSQGSPTCGKLDLGVLRIAAAKNDGLLMTEQGVPFRTTSQEKNIVFVSQWDNFPKQVQIPVKRPAAHACLLMASVTNPMQSGVVNGRVVFHLASNTHETLELVNPKNLSWCVTQSPNRYGPLDLAEPTVRLGENVAATLYSVPLPPGSQIESVMLQAVSNESVIGLLGLTLLPE